MKKISIVSASSFLFLLVCSLVAKISEGAFSGYIAPLVIGASLLLASGILALIVRESTPVNIFCSLLSAVAFGFILRAWYVLRGLENTMLVMMLVSLLAVLYLWVYFALIRIPFVRESNGISIAVTALYFIISIVGYVFLVLGTKTTFVSTLGFYMFVEASFILAMSFAVDNRDELIRNLTLSTYSVFVVAVIVAVFALMAAAGDGDCDCDCGGDCCCDAIDCGSDIGSGTKKRRKRKA